MKLSTSDEDIVIEFEHFDIFKFNSKNYSFVNDLKNYKLKNDKTTILNAGLLQFTIPIAEIDASTDDITVGDETRTVYTTPIPFNKGTLTFLSKTNEITQVKLDATPTSQLGIKTALQNLTQVEQINNLITASNELYNSTLNDFWLILLGVMETTRLQLSTQIYTLIEGSEEVEEQQEPATQTTTTTTTTTNQETPQNP